MTEHVYNKEILKPICKKVVAMQENYPASFDDAIQDKFDIKSKEAKGELYRLVSIVYGEAVASYNTRMQAKTTSIEEKEVAELEERPRLIYNAITTPDGTTIESKYRHNFVVHEDANGKEYAVDGGLDYARRCGDFQDVIELSLYDTEPHDVQREFLTWGTYGKGGDQPIQYKRIKDMDTEHIEAVLSECMPSKVRRVCMENELLYRGVADV